MKAKKLLLMAFLSLFLMAITNASNVSINTIPKVEIQTGDAWATITFDISWDNSWRTSKPNNHDAVWLFVKCWDGEKWNHAYLDSVSTAHTGIITGKGNNYQAGNKNATGYYVCNKDSTVTNCEMEFELGFSQVQYQWGSINPNEARRQGVVGVFLRRSVLGEGHVNIKDVILPWRFVKQGFTSDDDLVVKVFAIEMVYVPTGNFYLGAGQGSTASINLNAFSANNTNIGFPFQVTSAGAITVSSTAGNLWATGSIAAGTVPTTFPNGYNAFYIMKYEVTQGAYADFLNSLTEAQANSNINNGPIQSMAVNSLTMYPYGNAGQTNVGNVFNRRAATVLKVKFPNHVFGVDGNQNGVIDEVGAATKTDAKNAGPATVWQNDGHNVAQTWARHSFTCSYADWACLRPMTELEYEKACRGNQEAKANEFAWGQSTIAIRPIMRSARNNSYTWEAHNLYTAVGAATPDGQGWSMNGADERPAAMNYYNAAWGVSSVSGMESDNGVWWKSGNCGNTTRAWYVRHWRYGEPVRVGMLAGANTNRQGSGASYWGVMNLSDNAREPVINASTAAVRAGFKGTHGDGQLQANGMSNVGSNDWAIFTNATMNAYASGQIFYNRGILLSDIDVQWYTTYSARSGWWANCHSGGPPAAAGQYWFNTENNYVEIERLGRIDLGRTASRATAGIAQSVDSWQTANYFDYYRNAWTVNTAYADFMQGIRCVRSARMSNQSTPTTGIHNITQ
jgi:hypothetical protein